jgi:hypothetical protein
MTLLSSRNKKDSVSFFNTLDWFAKRIIDELG